MSTPYLHSERHFRLYEQYIRSIVEHWPACVTFVPIPPVASVETLSSRIRLAKEALRSNIQSNQALWPTEIPTDKFIQIVDEIVVSTTVDPGKVVCGPAEGLRQLRASKLGGVGPLEQPTEQVVPKINLNEPDHELLVAILTLHHYRLLSEPSHITTSTFHDEIAKFVQSHDIAVSRSGNTYTIL